MLSSQQIREIVGDSIFTVDFIKRSTGQLRVMNCRLGVRPSREAKAPPRYDPNKYDLLNVYDLQIGEYRCVPLENVVEIRARGQVIKP